jgi:hypothetical protein
MTEPEKPREGGPTPYTLPSWIDKAIARSKSDEDSAEGDPVPSGNDGDSPAEETETHQYPQATEAPPPPRPWDPDDADTREMVPSFIGAGETRTVEYPAVPETPIVVAESEAKAQSAAPEVEGEETPGPDRVALGWIVAALFLTAAALVLAYLIWLRLNPM